MSGPPPSARPAGRPGLFGRRDRTGDDRLAGRRTGSVGDRTDWFSRVFGPVAVVIAGVVLGMQYLSPNKRVLAVIGAAIVGGLAWRLSMVAGIGLLIAALPYPRGTVFGSTNVVLVMGMILIWLLRASLRQAPAPHRSAVDAPVLALLGAYVISFYNIGNAEALRRALENFLHLLAGMGMFYLIVNNVRRPEDLERVHVFQCVSIALVGLFGIYEINHPSGVLIAGWIEFHHVVAKNVTGTLAKAIMPYTAAKRARRCGSSIAPRSIRYAM